MISPKLKPIFNLFLGILFFYSLFLLWKLPQPYGIFSITVLIVGLAFNFFKSRSTKILIFSLAVAISSFCLFMGTQFLLDNIQKRKLFDLDTAVSFEKGSFEMAIRKAKEQKKHIFIDFYTAWCGPCLEFSRNVLTDDKVGEAMNKVFVNLKFDAEKGEGIMLAKKYNVSAYPTLLIVDTQGNIVERVIKEHFLPDKKRMIDTAEKYLTKEN